MLLSHQTDFYYDDQATSSNSPGDPAGDGSSGRGYRDTITEAVSGFIGNIGGFIRGSDGPGRDDGERRNDYLRRNYNERHNDNWGRDSLRDSLRDIAVETLQILDDGEYFPPGQDGPYDLKAKIQWAEENTRYYGSDAGKGGEILESEFIKIKEEGGDEGKVEMEEDGSIDGITGAGEEANNASYLNDKRGKNESDKGTAAASKPHDDHKANPKDQTRVQATVSPDPPKKATLDHTQTAIYVGEYSTLVGARKVYLALARNTNPSANNKIGVLNFASAKKPGGGFINGSQAQEESLARASTLYPSLITDAASQFYTHYHEDPSNAYYTHAMVYSPGIVLIRDDKGEWRSPVEVDVLTSAAVNAGDIRRELERKEKLRKERVEMEYWKKRGEERRKEVERAMAERQRLREEKAEKQRKREENKKAMEEKGKLTKKQHNSVKLKTEMVKIKETDKGNTKDSGSEKEEPFDDQEKAVAEVENENEQKENGDEEVENEENTIDSPDNGLEYSDSQLKGAEDNAESKGTLVQDDQLQHGLEYSDSQLKGAEENAESKETLVQDDQPQHGLEYSDSQLKGAEENAESKETLVQDDQPHPEVPTEVNQKATFSSTVARFLSPSAQPSQAPVPDPNLTHARVLKNAEIQIEHTMYDRISRILHLFQLQQTPHLILGSFGTGVFKNRTDLIANIFADLLIKPGGRFRDVFQTVVFAILGKETVRVFSDVFMRADKRGQRERTGKTRVFVDSFGRDESDGEVREGNEQKRKRMMRWRARRSERERERYSFMYDMPDAAASAASFGPAQVDAGFDPLSFDTAQGSPFSDPTFSAAADAAFYTSSFDAAQAGWTAYAASSNDFQGSTVTYAPSFNAAQASVASYPPSFDTFKASAISYPTSFAAALQQADAAVQANPTAVDYHGIPEDAEMILTRDDEQVDFVAEATPNAPITPKAMVVDDGKDIEKMETKSLPTRSHEAPSSKSNKKEDGDIEMQ